MKPPRLDQLNIVVGDMGRSLAFYSLLGLDVSNLWQSPTGHQHASAAGTSIDLDFDNTSFAQKWNTGWAGRNDLGGRVVVGFKVSDRVTVDQLYAKLTGAGHTGLQPPIDAFWGARYASVADPDGLCIGLMSPIDEAMKSQPPE